MKPEIAEIVSFVITWLILGLSIFGIAYYRSKKHSDEYVCTNLPLMCWYMLSVVFILSAAFYQLSQLICSSIL